MRVGIFGGAFNPPHIGHLVCAQEALWQLELDHIVFMPAGEAPHKQIEQDPGREARYELCQLAVASDERLVVSRLEIDKRGPAYTVETLRALAAEMPERELVFVVGSDQAEQLPSWHEPGEVLKLARIAIAARKDARHDQLRAAVSDLDGGDRLEFFEMPLIDVSSSMVRQRIVDGRPFQHLVPERVADRIERVGLYRERATA